MHRLRTPAGQPRSRPAHFVRRGVRRGVRRWAHGEVRRQAGRIRGLSIIAAGSLALAATLTAGTPAVGATAETAETARQASAAGAIETTGYIKNTVVVMSSPGADGERVAVIGDEHVYVGIKTAGTCYTVPTYSPGCDWMYIVTTGNLAGWVPSVTVLV